MVLRKKRLIIFIKVLGELLNKLERYDELILMYDKAIEFNPK